MPHVMGLHVLPCRLHFKGLLLMWQRKLLDAPEGRLAETLEKAVTAVDKLTVVQLQCMLSRDI